MLIDSANKFQTTFLNDCLIPFKFDKIVNEKSTNGENYLHYLLNNLNDDNVTEISKMVKIMVANGCDPNLPNGDLETPFYLLLKKLPKFSAENDLVSFVISNSTVDFYSHNHNEVAQLMSKLGFQHKIPPRNRLDISFIEQWTEFELIKIFANLKPDTQDFVNGMATIMEEAVIRDLSEVVDILLRMGANVNDIPANSKFKLAPAFLACALGHHKVLSVLLSDPKLKFESESLKCNMLHQLFSFDKIDVEDRSKCFHLIIMDRRCTLDIMTPLMVENVRHYFSLVTQVTMK